MSYLKKPSISQQQRELRKLIDERLESEESKVKERIYQWLNNNQYFVDNELFDFYFSVAQNIAAVEKLGCSGEKIVKAKNELEHSAEAYKTQIFDTSTWINEQLKDQLENIQRNQHKLDMKLIYVLDELTREHQNIKTISNGLVNSISVLFKKQKQLLIQTEVARKSTATLVVFCLSILLITTLVANLIWILFEKQ